MKDNFLKHIKSTTAQTGNPGAFKRRKRTRLTYFLKYILKTMTRGDFRDTLNFMLSESVNIYNDRAGRFQTGGRYQCNICGYEGVFVHKSNRLGIAWNSICPQCDSRSRHRGLDVLYRRLIPPGSSVLHFAPEPVLSRIFSGNDNYKTTDFFLQDVDFPGEDIQNLTLAADQFDWVLCNHVLEHVPNDTEAIKNIARVLKHGGSAIITIPGNYARAKTVYFKDLSLNGHYRDYGIDVLEKLRIYFSDVRVVDLCMAANQFAVRKGEVAFVCTRN